MKKKENRFTAFFGDYILWMSRENEGHDEPLLFCRRFSYFFETGEIIHQVHGRLKLQDLAMADYLMILDMKRVAQEVGLV